MAGKAINGKVFGATELVTNTKLDDQFLLGSLTGIVAGDFATGFDPVHIAAVAPTSLEGRLWYDTVTNVLKARHTEQAQDLWVPVGRGDQFRAAEAIAAGECVRFDTASGDDRVKLLSNADTSVQSFAFAGVALTAVANGDYGVFITRGLVSALTRILTKGDLLTPSNSTGQFEGVGLSASTARSAVYGFALEDQGVGGNATNVYLFSGASSAFGEDIADAITGATTPSSSNTFLTAADAFNFNKETRLSWILTSGSNPTQSIDVSSSGLNIDPSMIVFGIALDIRDGTDVWAITLPPIVVRGTIGSLHAGFEVTTNVTAGTATDRALAYVNDEINKMLRVLAWGAGASSIDLEVTNFDNTSIDFVWSAVADTGKSIEVFLTAAIHGEGGAGA